ncbi:MAG: HAD family hydrolase [Alphaproteobacteria bacterium]|nr:HAD family hydrolase [Alphaproteobacteria bacterium]
MNFPEINKLPDAIFWDWDGTIVDSYQFLSDIHSYTLRTLGKAELKDGEFKDYFGMERLHIFSSIYGSEMENAIEIFQNRVMETNHMIKPMEGIKELMAVLKEKDIKLGVVTNKRRSYVAKELELMGLDKFLPIVVCSTEASRDKPFPDPLLLAIEKAGLYPRNNEIWYVGDTETDLICANDTGCRSVFLKGHRDTDSLLSKYSPYISFDNYSFFKDFLVAI